MALTAKQQKFVEEYLIDLNATQAALRAGYSKKTAQQTGSENLLKPVIAKALQELQNNRSDRTKIDADYVLMRHREIDQLDVLEILKDDMTGFRPLTEWPKAWRISITGIDIAEIFEYNDGKKDLTGLLKKIKWPDKTRNLELLGKHVDVQAYKENINANVTNTHNIMPVPTAASAEDWEKTAKQQQEKSLSE